MAIWLKWGTTHDPLFCTKHGHIHQLDTLELNAAGVTSRHCGLCWAEKFREETPTVS